jgi:hypothetical protein
VLSPPRFLELCDVVVDRQSDASAVNIGGSQERHEVISRDDHHATPYQRRG